MSEHPDSGAGDILRYTSLKALADDGVLDLEELRVIEDLATRDGVVDVQEKRVLYNIFSRFSKSKVSPEVWAEIEAIQERCGL